MNSTFERTGLPMFFLSIIVIVIFGIISYKKEILNDELNNASKNSILGISFIIFAVTLVTSLKRIMNKKGDKFIDPVINLLIASFLLYISVKPSTKQTSKFALFAGIYLILWQIGSPLLTDKFKNRSNKPKTIGVSLIYVIGSILLLVLQFDKKILNKEETTVKALKGGLMIITSFILLLMTVIAIKGSRLNNSNNSNNNSGFNYNLL